jgi:signal transduction histidine kinase
MALKRRVLETGHGERGQIDVTIDGKRTYYDICAEPLRAADGSIEGVTVASVDVTSHKSIEQDLLRTMADADEARKIAERANSTKDQFLATLSHELRTPLTPVMTLVQMLEGDSQVPENIRESLSTIRRNVELEIKLIDDLLDLTRVTRGKLALHYELVDVHDMLGHILQSCESDMRALRMQLTVELGAKTSTVHADAARLQQVLWNLLKNSVKFTPAGGHITLRTETESDYISISIQDNGIGIEPEALSRIFDAFEQGSTAITRQFGGLGLGLAISKSLIEMHGGTITASSAGRGKGSTFRILLPTAKEVALHLTPNDNAGGGDAENPSLAQLRVLLVEDHADTSKAMAQLLRSFGCRVRTADTVSAALKAAEAEEFNVVLSDLGLPDGSGLDLMRQLLAKHNIKGIAVSGFGMDEDIRKSHQAGFTAHLTKPINIKQLEQSLADVAVGR